VKEIQTLIKMFLFLGITIGLFMALVIAMGLSRREEIKANWSKYRTDPLYMFSAFLFRPDDDTRSRFGFAMDNFIDIANSVITAIIQVILVPLFSVFKMFGNALTSMIQALLGVRKLLERNWSGFNQVSGGFMRRFGMILHELRKTFFKLYTSFQRATGVATSAVFMGLSSIYSTLNFIDLVIKIILIILIILVVLVIFLFFIFAPFIPVILVVVGIITTTVFAGAVGGMADTFCFAENTLVVLHDGQKVPIHQVRVGDRLWGNTQVTATMEFAADTYSMYDYYGIQVSGDHIVYTPEGPTLVRNISHAIPISSNKVGKVYCLNTTTRSIPVYCRQSHTIVHFADWEELPSQDLHALREWNRHVHTVLNAPEYTWTAPSDDVLHTDAAIREDICVRTPNGSVHIKEIHPGTNVLDAEGLITRVVGVVRLASSEILKTPEGISAACWIGGQKGWMQHGVPSLASTERWATDAEEETMEWYQLFTESGSFLLGDGTRVRDFSDVGSSEIQQTYTMVLETLRSQKM
jgi:hypothetical protein